MSGAVGGGREAVGGGRERPRTPARSAADALRGLVQPPRRQRTILVLVGAALGAAVCWYFGLDVFRAVGLGVIAAAAGLAWVAVPDHAFAEWTPNSDTSRDGARRDVVQLSWSLRSRYGRVGHAALARLGDVAARRLAARGLSLTDPADQLAIERLIGSRAYRTLRGRGRQRLPRMRAFVHCLDAIEALDATPAPAAHVAPVARAAGIAPAASTAPATRVAPTAPAHASHTRPAQEKP